MNQSQPAPKVFLSLTSQEEHTLQGLHAVLREGSSTFVDDLYRQWMQRPGMRELVADGRMLQQLRKVHASFLDALANGAYGETRMNADPTPSPTGPLPSRYLDVYSHYATRLLQRLHEMPLGRQEQTVALQALMKVIFLDIRLAADGGGGVHGHAQTVALRDYSAVLPLLPYGTLVIDRDLQVVFCNKAFAQLMGSTPSALEGRSLATLMEGSDLTALAEHALSEHSIRRGVQLLPVEPALPIPAIIIAQPLRHADSEAPLLLLSVTDLRERVLALRSKGLQRGQYVRANRINRDTGERQQSLARMEQLASYDALTGLPNRVYGLALAQRLLDDATECGQQAAILFIDLDKFKEINDTHGHAIGDRVLASAARYGKRALAGRGVLARLGGDEFMVAVPLTDQHGAMAVAERVHKTLKQPLWVGGLEFELGASIGVALYPDHGKRLDDLLRCADTAMYRAKKQGSGCLIYNEEMGLQVQRRVELGARLATALYSSSLELHFQPKVDITTGQLRGVEALARWHDPEWGWVDPTEFIPAAEERRLITALGEWSLEEAARQWRVWHDAGVENPPPISVNVSVIQLMNDNFAERTLELVRMHGVEPGAIELEITESALMLDYDKAQRVASRLVDLGFSLAIDDFGAGYSSLARLHDLPVSKLKIDMSFVRGMLTLPRSLAVVTAVIKMARALKLRTVAEGVETPEQLEKLRGLRCDEAQGYLFAKALPAAEFERDWLFGL